MIGEQILLRLFALSTDQAPALLGTLPAYEWALQRARTRQLAGATMLRGIAGFGRRGIVPPPGFHLAQSVPVVCEFVDAGAAVARFLREDLLPHLRHGTITLERAAVMRYRHRGEPAAQPLELLSRVRDLSTLPEIEDAMITHEDGLLLRIFAGDSDLHDGRPLHEAIVHKARALGLRGATVLKGAMGFGAHSVMHTAKVLELSSDLPLVIEIVDSEEAIRRLLPEVDAMVKEGLITMEAVRIVAYRRQ